MSVSFVACSQVVEESGIHLHEGLENIVDEGDDSLVPMLFTYSKLHHVNEVFYPKTLATLGLVDESQNIVPPWSYESFLV